VRKWGNGTVGLSVIAVIGATLALTWIDSRNQTRASVGSSIEAARCFTVRDAIEMNRFGRSNAGPLVSPDGRYLAFVTSRGAIERDEVQSTLWIFGSKEVARFLGTDDAVKPPSPTRIAELAAVPMVEGYESYAPIISDVQWAADSKALLFLAQSSAGERQLYRVELGAANPLALSSAGYDVRQFDLAGGTIAYRATKSGDRPDVAPGDPINADASDVSGLPLWSILFPRTKAYDYANYSELWINRDGQNVKLTEPGSLRPVRSLNHIPDVLSVGPDGHFAVILAPVDNTPSSWKAFAGRDYARLRTQAGDPRTTNKINYLRPTEYTLVDLRTGHSEPLVDAPNGWAFGYEGASGAKWSGDGKKLLLLNTYLAAHDTDHSYRSEPLRPCVAAVIDLESHTESCTVSYPEDGKKLVPQGAGFEDSEKGVVVDFWNSDDRKTQMHFHWENGGWHLFDPSDYSPSAGLVPGDMRGSQARSDIPVVNIRQDLNTPPALWVSDRETGRSKKLWDPNPQLADFKLGETSTVHWTDSAGYRWAAGLVKPPDYVPGKRYPLVIQTHGFSEGEFMTDGAFTTAFAARPLAAVGILVLQLRDRPDHHATAAEASEQILGLESAIDRLVSDGLVDPQRVGIIGFSRSCYYVESVLIQDPDLFAAATVADGFDGSYFQYVLSIDGRVSYETDDIYGAPPVGNGFKEWAKRAPDFHWDRIRTPLRIEAFREGGPLGEWGIYAPLWRMGKSVDLIYIPGGLHPLQKPLERVASQQGNVDWFRFWLKDEEDPDSSKTKQYTRWRELRARRQGLKHP
jgi:WD40-like Beta Propeller Repeat